MRLAIDFIEHPKVIDGASDLLIETVPPQLCTIKLAF